MRVYRFDPFPVVGRPGVAGCGAWHHVSRKRPEPNGAGITDGGRLKAWKIPAVVIGAGLVLTGCTAVEIEPAPQTAPAVPTGSKPVTVTAASEVPWTGDDVRISGATVELEAQAQQALDSHAAYYAGISGGKYGQHLYAVNVAGIDRWLNITEVSSDARGAVEFVLDSNYRSVALERLAAHEACALVRFGTDDIGAVSWLKSFTLTSADSGDSSTFSDIEWCG